MVRGAEVDFDVRHEWRDEHEVTFFHIDPFGIAFAVVDASTALKHVAAMMGPSERWAREFRNWQILL